jgi:hypothetical protein
MECKDLLRIDDATYRRLLAEIHARSACGPQAGKRVAERYGLIVDKPFIAVFNHTKSVDREAYLVRPFDVSSTGMGFLHGRMEYQGTPVLVLARDLEGTMHKIEAQIAHIRLVSGRIHAVGVRLSKEIDPLLYAQDTTEAQRDRQQAAWQMGWTDLLRISNSDVDEIVTEIEQNDDPRRRTRRKDVERTDFREGAVLVVTHPDDPDRRHRYRAIPIDLSATGLGFLHGMFLHPGTVCDIMLMTLSGHTETVRGVVARCELARGRVHKVGLKFARPLSISRFIAGGSTSDQCAA